MDKNLISPSPWTIYKFGGSSLKDATSFIKVAKIIQNAQASKPLAIVVSAVYSTTNQLFRMLELNNQSKKKVETLLNEVQQTHIKIILNLITEPCSQTKLKQQIEDDINTIKQLLNRKPYQEETIAQVVGYGEQWSMLILSALLTNSKQALQSINARLFLIINKNETGPNVDWKKSQFALNQLLTPNPTDLLVITGYLASTSTQQPSLLERNGSDHSASIIGALLKAQAIHIWTDVDGLYTADPNRIKEAQLINEIQYQEAAELAYFGSEVLHPKTIEPAVNNNIPIFIRNTFKTHSSGTKITARTQKLVSHPKTCVKGFSTIENIALINIEGTGMIGAPGIAQRIFHTLQKAGISVIMISQASSQHSICLAIHTHTQHLAQQALQKCFTKEINDKKIASIGINPNCSLLAAVGNQMVNIPGVAARFFNVLAKANINLLAIAQGSSERNISVVIDNKEATRALQIAHSSFFLSDYSLSIGLIGPGNIGKTLLTQLEKSYLALKKNLTLDLRLRGIISSKKMLLTEDNLLQTHWADKFNTTTQTANLNTFIQHINAEHFSHCVLIDCTSSQDIAMNYESILKKNISIITPNKKANSSQLNYFNRLHNEKFNAYYLYESTVGAGLPVISTLKDLIKTGDTLLKIEGVFSGTLSYIFSKLTEGQSFAEAVKTAFDQGLTEPDVRDDLSGMDVARKTLILGRIMGLNLEIEDLSIETLIPNTLSHIEDPKIFLSELPKHDKKINDLVQKALNDKKIIRYVGSVSSQGATAQIRTFQPDHIFSKLQGTDNIIAFYTQRYQHQPLIIQGPGAGPDVTAAGIFADLLRLASYLGATT